MFVIIFVWVVHIFCKISTKKNVGVYLLELIFLFFIFGW